MEPGHGKGGRAAGAEAHCGAAVRIGGEPDFGDGLDARQDLALDPFGVGAGDGVVFAAALGALSVLAAGADPNRDDRRQAARCDHVVEDGEEHALVEETGRTAIAEHDERRQSIGWEHCWDVDVDLTLPASGVAGGHEQV